MGQVPTNPPILWTPTFDDAQYVVIRRAVEREVFGQELTTPGSQFRTDVNRIGDDVFFDYTNLCKWWVYTDPNFEGPKLGGAGQVPDATTDVPAVFNEYFKILFLSKCMRRFRSAEKGDMYFKAHAGPLFERIATYFETLSGFSGDVTVTTGAMSVNSILRYVLTALVRQRTPVVPPFSLSHGVVRDEFVKLWKEKRWNWKIRLKQFTITSNGDVVLALVDGEDDPDIIDGIASKHIIIRNASTSEASRPGRTLVQWLDSERFANARVFYHTQTGTPKFFYDEDRTPLVIHFLPAPDQDYTAFAMLIIGPPPFVNDRNDTAAFDQMPEPFRAHLRERILARMLHLWGREDTDTARHMAAVKAEAAELTGVWEDRGAHRYSARPHHHMKYVRDRSSYRGMSIIGQIE